MPKEKKYVKDNGLTSDDIKRKAKKAQSDDYLFDVEYEKLKKEQERLDRLYEKQREQYLRISEELREEMMNGTASEADMARFTAVLTNKGVQLQQQQMDMQKEIDDIAGQRADISNQMNELRLQAFSGTTTARSAEERNYDGFKLDNTSNSRYGNAKIVEMSPQEYLRRIAFGFHNGSLDALIDNASPASVEKYMRQMLRGVKFNAPSSKGGSKETERALAALMNGYSRIPVLVIE